MEYGADDIPFCQEILRVILEAPELMAESVTPQKDVHKLLNRSVRLDVLCRLGTGCMQKNMQNKEMVSHGKSSRYRDSGF